MIKFSKTHCPLPYMAVDVFNKKFSPCCHVNKELFSSYLTIEDYYQSKELKILQNNLASGFKDPCCNECWKNEDAGIMSMRQSVLQDRSFQANKINQIKLHTGNTCNLACMMCFPSISNTWNKLWINSQYPEEFVKEGHEHYDQQIENYIKNHIDDILFIETLGGEPLMSKQFINLLEWIINSGRAKNITIYIITNLTFLPKSLVAILKHFKKIVLTVSIEGIGRVNDYIRWGSNFEKINENIKIALKKGFDIGLLPTASSLNLHRLNEIFIYADSLKIPVMNISIVKGWSSLHPINLPEYLHNRVVDKFKKLLAGPQVKGNLKEFVIRWDRQRNINILDYMPEFEEFIK